MKSEKNKLIELGNQQQNPGLANPEDFKIESEQLEFGGACGDSPAEYRRLLAERDKGRPAKGKTNYQSRPRIPASVKGVDGPGKDKP